MPRLKSDVGDLILFNLVFLLKVFSENKMQTVGIKLNGGGFGHTI